ncbi:MAG TPA: MarR family transcriptional regulator [Polyangiales bacterium]|nr:MarR family transcriptional regulator [Polyangiales bacterium]
MSTRLYATNLKNKRTAADDALTALILDLMKLNSLILLAGDRLVEPLGLTSARWQILGAIVANERPQPVAWLARDLGANRQNVQRIINDLEHAGLVTFEENPHHRRAQLVVLTDEGRRVYEAAMRLQTPWVQSLSKGFPLSDLEAAHELVNKLRERLA